MVKKVFVNTNKTVLYDEMLDKSPPLDITTFGRLPLVKELITTKHPKVILSEPNTKVINKGKTIFGFS